MGVLAKMATVGFQLTETLKYQKNKVKHKDNKNTKTLQQGSATCGFFCLFIVAL